MDPRLEKPLLIASLVFIGLLVYSPHFGYPYPLHVDEWKHISFTLMLKNGELRENDLEMGFKLFLLPFSYVSDIVLIYRYFPVIFAVLSALILFYFMRRDFGLNEALLSIVFFASLKTNINILGTQLFVPLTFSIPFIYAYMFLLHEGLERGREDLLKYSMAIMVLVLFVHPISVTFALPVIALHLLAKRESVMRHRGFFMRLLPILMAAFAVLGLFLFSQLNRLISEGHIGSINLMNFVFFRGDVNVFEYHYFLPALYGILPIAAALIGANKVLKERKYLFLLWPLAAVFSLWLFINLRVSLLASYQRMVYYTMLGLVPLSSIGLVEVIGRVRGYGARFRLDARLVNAFIALTLLTTFASAFSGYFEQPSGLDLRKAIGVEEYHALRHLRNFPRGTVITDKWTSSAVYPVSGHSIVADPFFFGTSDGRADLERFFSSGCPIKNEIIKKYGASYVLSKERIDCAWREVYNNRAYVYWLKEPEKKPPIDKVIVIGLDGADWDILMPLVKQGRLKNIKSLMEEGSYGNLSSIEPFKSSAAWTSIVTGVLPEKHGITDFVVPGKDRFFNSTDRKWPAIWDLIGSQKAGIVMVPMTYPAEEINGFMVSSYPSFAFSIEDLDDKSVTPIGLKGELLEKVGNATLNLVSFYSEDFGLDSSIKYMDKALLEDLEIKISDAAKENPQRFMSATLRLLEDEANIAISLFGKHKPDFFMVVFSATDTPQHYYWPAGDEYDNLTLLENMYAKADELIGSIVELSDDRTAVFVVSDHGFGAEKIGYVTARKHAKNGIIVVKGPGIRESTEIKEASLLDVTPTVAYLMGLRWSFDGRVLYEILKN